jgi:hypothetical protein
MVRLLSCLLLAALAEPLSAQTAPNTGTSPAKEPSWTGLRLASVPEVLRAHLKTSQLRKGHGLVVEDVLPNSPAARQGLKRHDVLLAIRSTPIRDAAHFTQLVQPPSGSGKLPLTVIRSGQELVLQVDFSTNMTSSHAELIKGLSKPGSGPPELTVQAEPLTRGKLQVVFIYYPDGKGPAEQGKYERVECSGTLAEIEERVRRWRKDNHLPDHVQDLVDVAMRRVRMLNFDE